MSNIKEAHDKAFNAAWDEFDIIESISNAIASYVASLEANGFVIVPVEATEEMREAFFQARDEYLQWKKDRVFPRPTLADHCFSMLIAARQMITDGGDE